MKSYLNILNKMNFVKQRNNMVKVVDKNDFTVSKEDIMSSIFENVLK